MANEEVLLTLLLQHKWIPALAFLVGLLIRLLKDDTKGPALPKRLRAPLAFALGFTAATLQRRMSGSTWQQAIIAGIVTGLLPIAGHLLLIEKLRKGIELKIPGLMKLLDEPAKIEVEVEKPKDPS